MRRLSRRSSHPQKERSRLIALSCLRQWALFPDEVPQPPPSRYRAVRLLGYCKVPWDEMPMLIWLEVPDTPRQR
jgi:hypothetical protein